MPDNQNQNQNPQPQGQPQQQPAMPQQPVQGQYYVQQPMQGQPMYVQQQPVQGQVYMQQPVQGQPMYVQQPVQGQMYVQQPVQGQPYPQQPMQGQPVQMQYVQTPMGMQAMPVASPAPNSQFGEAFKMLISDPVGKMRQAYEHLGTNRALGLGVVFSAIFATCFVIAMAIWRKNQPEQSFIMLSGNPDLTPAEVLRAVVVAVLIVLGLSLGSLVCRSMSTGGGSFSQDIFVAGLALLPLAPAMIIGTLFSANYPQVTVAAILFGGSFLVQAVYAAGTDLHGLTKKASSIMTPTVILATAGVAYLIHKVLPSS